MLLYWTFKISWWRRFKRELQCTLRGLDTHTKSIIIFTTKILQDQLVHHKKQSRNNRAQTIKSRIKSKKMLKIKSFRKLKVKDNKEKWKIEIKDPKERQIRKKYQENVAKILRLQLLSLDFLMGRINLPLSSMNSYNKLTISNI